MPRQQRKSVKYCDICGDVASGINFGALTCYSCKSFFRRNAQSLETKQCLFGDQCRVEKATRRFCSFCRLKKCFQMGMKKEWILTEEEKRLVKERQMTINFLRLQKQRAMDAKEHKETLESTLTKQLLKQKILQNQALNQTKTSGNADSQFAIAPLQTPSPLASIEPIVETPTSNTFDLATPTFDPPSLTLFDLANPSHRELLTSSCDLEFNSELEALCDQILQQNEDGDDDSLCDSLDLSTFEASEELVDLNRSQDYISNYLMLIQYKVEDTCFSSVCQQICFPKHDLILPEKYLLQDLVNACAYLKNPYKKILYYQDVYHCRAGQPTRVSPYLVNRMHLMSQKLEPLKQLEKKVQEQLLQCSLIEMLIMQSVLFCDPDRQSWGLLDDKYKATVMVPMTIIKPYCHTYPFGRHQNLPKLFRAEWKSDNIIMDLMTAIILFTPRNGVGERDRIRQAQIGYIRLLQKYLAIKYADHAEAESAYQSLLQNIEEIRTLSVDVINFFANYRAMAAPSAPGATCSTPRPEPAAILNTFHSQ